MATPTGTMNTAQTPISQMVPQSPDWIPESAAVIEEKLVMKLHVRFGAPSIAMSTRRTPSRSIASPRQPNMASRKPMSLRAVGRRGLADRAGARALADCVRHSYTCRYFRTKRIEIRFMIRVSTNSVVPTAKMVL